MKKIRLGDAVAYSDKRGKSKDLQLETFVTTDNLLQNKQGIKQAVGLPPKGDTFQKYEVDDILISNIRPYLKKIWYSTRTGLCSTDVLTITAHKGFLPKFIYYCLHKDDFFEHMMNGSKGTKMPRGDKRQILDFEIPNLNPSTQIKMVELLNSIDEKISINNKLNDNLERLAKAVYDYWFVQFDFPDNNGKPYKSANNKMVYNKQLNRMIPQGWVVGNFKEWIKKIKPGDWGKEAAEGNYVHKVTCIRGADINDLNGKGEVCAPQRYILTNNISKILEENDFVIEISGGSPTQSTGRISLITNDTLDRFKDPLICSNFCKALSLNDKSYVFNFLFEWQRLYSAGLFFGYEGKTSGIKNFLFESFTKSYPIILPPKLIVDQFYNLVAGLEKQKQKNLKQNQVLNTLRDWLLPMLMNEQVKVK